MIHTVAFDLDGTLAHSKNAISDKTAQLLVKLMRKHNVAIITGASIEQLKKQYIPIIERNYAHNWKLGNSQKLHYLFTTSGSRCDSLYPIMSYGNIVEFKTNTIFHYRIPDTIKHNVISILNGSVLQLFKTLNETPVIYGDQVEDRIGQITLSVLGQQAPLSDKLNWDPAGTKRQLLKSLIELKLKEANVLDDVDVKLGGLTSVDVTNKNINKKSAIQYLAKYIKEEDIMYFGDALYEGGNDHIVTKTKAICMQTISPDMTNHMIQTLFDL